MNRGEKIAVGVFIFLMSVVIGALMMDFAGTTTELGNKQLSLIRTQQHLDVTQRVLTLDLQQLALYATRYTDVSFTALQNRNSAFYNTAVNSVAYLQVFYFEKSTKNVGGITVEIQTPKRMVGSGVLIMVEGHPYLFTATHVIAPKGELIAIFASFPKSVIATPVSIWSSDATADIALLNFDQPTSVADGSPATLETTIPAICTPLMSIGTPLDVAYFPTIGTLHYTFDNTLHHFPQPRLLAHSAYANQGCSGGPLFSLQSGNVVGWNLMVLTSGHFPVSLAVPSTDILALLPQLLRGGLVKRGTIGITVCNSRQLTPFHLLGLGAAPPTTQSVVITHVEDKSAAAKLELTPGDIILTCDGQPVLKTSDVRCSVFYKVPGEKIKLTGIKRDGKTPFAYDIILDPIQ